MFWRTINETFYVIPENNLKFERGSINEVSIEPQLRTFSASQFSSSYQIDYSVYPTAVKGYYSLTSGRTPILLIHGLHGSDNIDTSDTSTWTYWHSVPTKLKDKNNDVWILFYTPANVSNFLTSGMLKNEINDVLSYYSVSKLDVVSHSMGGLVTMGYLLNLGRDQFGNSVTYANNIRNFVSIDTPAHGSFSANRVVTNQNLGSNLICNFLAWATGKGYDKDAQAYLDMAVGGEFTWLLHQSSLPTSISYLAIAGNEGMLCIPDETKEENSGDPGSGNDGLVAVSSASLLDKNIPLIILGNYNHANEVGTDPTGLFSVDTTKEVNIIDSFIKGQSVNTIKSYLGSGDYYIDPNNPSSNIFTRGSIVLKLTSNNPISSVKIKNPSNNQEYILTKFLDLRHNTQTNNWFYFSDNDLGMPYTNQRYGLTLPKGNYDIYINGEYTGQNVLIKGAQTTMQEVIIENQTLCSSGVCCDLSSGTTKPLGGQPSNSVDNLLCEGQSRIFQDYYCDGINSNLQFVNESVLEICSANQQCSPNACLDIISNPIPRIEIFIQNEDFFNQNDIEFSFNVTDWNISGKGQNHVHFHVDGIPGLNFSDHLMFYNFPNNIVELNLQSGQTAFATWVNSNTIRINNMPNGLHRLRAHLATPAHTIPPNPEADTEIEFLVSSTNNIYGLIGNNNSGVDDDFVLGNSTAPVTMIMFGDYQDPFSQRFWNETLPIIKSQYIDTGKVKFVYRDFPLGSIHPYAQALSEIAECVGEYGDDAYYQMFNELFEKGVEGFGTLGYDIEDCFYSGQMAEEVIQDLLDGQEMDVQGTPTFFINGEIISGAQQFENFQALIEEKLNESIVCFSDIGCGVDRFIDFPYCSLNNVVQSFQNFICNDPGTANSSCSSSVSPITKEVCTLGCFNGQCNIPKNCSNNNDCSLSEVCKFEDGLCGEGIGICVIKPNICPHIYEPVCGCDGITYGNRCIASSQGININFEGECIISMPKLTINSPINNSIWNTRRIPIDIEINKIVDEISYIDLADNRAREKRLCRNCNGYGNDRVKFLSLLDGRHRLKFMARENGQIADEEIISITIDSRDPRISRTEPRRGFADGVFEVEFDEENPVSLKLRYGNSIVGMRETSLNIQTDCFLDRNRYKCDKGVIINDFSGQSIQYWFELEDIAGNKVQSRPLTLDVDTTLPIINSITHNARGRSVELIIDITEQNFDEVSYIDSSNPRSRERVLCTSLRNGHQCTRRISLSPGQHNLVINVIDEAGNSAKPINIQFECNRTECFD